MIDSILALCARAESHPDQLRLLQNAIENEPDWRTLPFKAEENALAPLVYAHLKAASIMLPSDVSSVMAALTLRHKRANEIRYSVLSEILTTLNTNGIEVLVLKGAALATTLYPSPGLRPMRDIDIMVKDEDALRTQLTLFDLDFRVRGAKSKKESRSHHLPVAQKIVDGLTVSVEVHKRLLPGNPNGLRYQDLSINPVTFLVNGVPAITLCHEEMLWHIYRHSFAAPLLVQPLRLIWVADYIGLVEKYWNEIDWEKVRNLYPQLWHIRSLFHHLTPWSKETLKKLDISIEPAPKGIGLTFIGWPKSSLTKQIRKGMRRCLLDTFWPPEWWTWLYYGVPRDSTRWWFIRFFRHPLHITSWVLQYFTEPD